METDFLTVSSHNLFNMEQRRNLTGKSLRLQPIEIDIEPSDKIDFQWKANFGWIPEALSGATRPYHSVTETEKTVIDKEVLNFLLKGIARLYLYEDVLLANVNVELDEGSTPPPSCGGSRLSSSKNDFLESC
ncbi:hypothetical protein P5673_009772 [Acropora cervicornis]|uniref:Uncharacterized protein n=1 Tax=Acropora cervicornis TaxID=6130 RepID=A0AAD9QRY9_ACRCE|nr:hypothetical protein P5673_009772 [Acropora cervicornis]